MISSDVLAIDTCTNSIVAVVRQGLTAVFENDPKMYDFNSG